MAASNTDPNPTPEDLEQPSVLGYSNLDGDEQYVNPGVIGRITSFSKFQFNIFIDALKKPKFWRSLISEFTATLLLVLLGCGTSASASALIPDLDSKEREYTNLSFLIYNSLTWGGLIASLSYTFGDHSVVCNPAATLGFMILGRIHIFKGFVFMILQTIAAVLASALVYIMVPNSLTSTRLGNTSLAENISPLRGVLVETVITFTLMTVILTSHDQKEKKWLQSVSALPVALIIMVNIFFAAPLTGASMNPARSFGPALVSWNFENHWVYWVGPMLGSVLATISFYVVYKLTYTRPSQEVEKQV